MALVKIEGNNHFYRDTNTMALVNRDSASKDEYFMKRKLLQSQKQEINTIKAEIDGIKSDVYEIKLLMRQLLDKGSNG
jgi:gluconate kinase